MAIALDSSNITSALTGPTLTFSHTCSGSNRILFVGAFAASATTETITGVTYNSVAMTRIDFNNPQSNWELSLWYLIAPSTGAHNVVITASTTVVVIAGASISYTGALQSGVPDSSAKKTQSTTSITQSTTVVASNCWVVGWGTTGNGSISAGSGMTSRGDIDSPQGSFESGDSNGTVATGAYSMTLTGGGSDSMGIIMASFAPAASTVNSNFLSFM